jgi:hypothetical protein
MRSLIKTTLVAAVGAAVVVASPAFAAKAKQDRRVGQSYQGAVYGYAPGYGVQNPAPFWNDPGAGQIVLEYLKDAPIHNGNAY